MIVNLRSDRATAHFDCVGECELFDCCGVRVEESDTKTVVVVGGVSNSVCPNCLTVNHDNINFEKVEMGRALDLWPTSGNLFLPLFFALIRGSAEKHLSFNHVCEQHRLLTGRPMTFLEQVNLYRAYQGIPETGTVTI